MGKGMGEGEEKRGKERKKNIQEQFSWRCQGHKSEEPSIITICFLLSYVLGLKKGDKEGGKGGTWPKAAQKPIRPQAMAHPSELKKKKKKKKEEKKVS